MRSEPHFSSNAGVPKQDAIDPWPLQPSTRIGEYEIQVLIGAGGMGEVCSALDTRLNRAVAVERKRTPASWLSAETSSTTRC